MDLHSSNPYSRVSNIPVPVFGRRPCTQGFRSTSSFHHVPSSPQGLSRKRRESHTGVFRGQSWEVHSTPPVSASTTQSSGHVSTPNCNCNLPRIKRSWCLWIHNGLWFVFYPGGGPCPSPSTMTGFAALHWLWLFYHFQWRDHSELMLIL